MSRLDFVLLSLLFPSCAAHAACSVSASDAGTLSITVDGGRCFESVQQRTIFAAGLKSAVGAMSPQRGHAGNDTGQAGRVSGFHDLQGQADTLHQQRGPVGLVGPVGPIYYGQRHQ
jgi:hypothetical protein